MNLRIEKALYEMVSTLNLPATVHCRSVSSKLPENQSSVIAVCEQADRVTRALWRAQAGVILTSPSYPGSPERHFALAKTLESFFRTLETNRDAYRGDGHCLNGIFVTGPLSTVEGERNQWQLGFVLGVVEV